MGDPKFVKRFRAAERPGIYCRVIQPGQVQAGDPIVYTEYPGEKISVLEMFRAAYVPELDQAALRRFLAAPIDIRSRREWEEKLAS
jgi:MOSC domain-containing protein YiiM